MRRGRESITKGGGLTKERRTEIEGSGAKKRIAYPRGKNSSEGMPLQGEGLRDRLRESRPDGRERVGGKGKVSRSGGKERKRKKGSHVRKGGRWYNGARASEEHDAIFGGKGKRTLPYLILG